MCSIFDFNIVFIKTSIKMNIMYFTIILFCRMKLRSLEYKMGISINNIIAEYEHQIIPTYRKQL